MTDTLGIVELAEKVKALLKVNADLKTAGQQVKQIENTKIELEKLNTSLTEISRSYRLIKTRLPTDTQITFESDLGQLIKDLENSRQAFWQQQQPDQTVNLRRCGERAKRLTDLLRGSWRNYVAKQLNPLVNLLNLVVNLPEVAAQRAELQNLKHQLTSFQNSLPQSNNQLQKFDTQLESFRTILQNLEFEPEVRLFLEKIQTGTATIADLNETVLNWCKQGQRAKTFFIKLG
jgi:Tfp pilus assembly protein PilO